MVDILMATYNGEKYLNDQISSIISQTYKDWILFIRDDGSTDGTIDIIKKFVKKYNEKIIFVNDDITCKSAKGNFIKLIDYSIHDYIMFCDQDDIWNKNKVEKFVLEMEKHSNLNRPILIASNLEVVDDKLNVMKNKKMFINKRNLTINKILVENEIPGCCMMFNKELLSLIKGIDYANIIMHDWWVLFVALYFGEVYIIDEKLMLYRQHGDNSSGASNKYSFTYFIHSIKNNKKKSSINQLFTQSAYFYEKYGSLLHENKKKILYKFINMRNRGKLYRIFIIIKYKFWKSGIFRKIGELFYI